jgi:HEAT repeat protein
MRRIERWIRRLSDWGRDTGGPPTVTVDAQGRPDLEALRSRSAEAWYEDYIDARRSFLAEVTGGSEAIKERSFALHERRVMATWGLIARGPEATPFALQMLASTDAEVRADGAGVLAELRSDPAVIDRLIEAVPGETDPEALDTLVQALGAAADARAIPVLAGVLRNHGDDETRWGGMEALQRITGQNWSRRDDALAAAIAWLDANGH